MGVVPQGREGVVKQEEFLCTEQFPHRGPQRGAAKSGKARQSWALEGTKQRKLHSSDHKQLTDYGPNQMAGSGNQRKPGEVPWCRGWARMSNEGWHTNFCSTHNPCCQSAGPGRWKKNTQTLQHRGWAQWAKSNAHKLQDIEGEPSEPKQLHTNPSTQMVSSGSWGKPTEVSTMLRARLGAKKRST